LFGSWREIRKGIEEGIHIPVWYGGFEGEIKRQIMMDSEDLFFFYYKHNSHPIPTSLLGN
jgi:hypothetical protein